MNLSKGSYKKLSTAWWILKVLYAVPFGLIGINALLSLVQSGYAEQVRFLLPYIMRQPSTGVMFIAALFMHILSVAGLLDPSALRTRNYARFMFLMAVVSCITPPAGWGFPGYPGPDGVWVYVFMIIGLLGLERLSAIKASIDAENVVS